MKQMIKDALILFAITIVAGALLGVVYQITLEPIRQQNIKAVNQACAEVFHEAASFEDMELTISEGSDLYTMYPDETVDGVKAALSEDGSCLGYVVTVTSHEGYGGDIQFMMGIKLDGTLNGMSILAISETAGLGMKADDVLKPQFANKNVTSFVYTKTGASADNQIDAISGATITTNAVVNGVNAGLYYFQTELEGGSTNE